MVFEIYKFNIAATYLGRHLLKWSIHTGSASEFTHYISMAVSLRWEAGRQIGVIYLLLQKIQLG